MKKHKISLAKRLISFLAGLAMMATMITILIPLPVANAAAATSVITSAKFSEVGLAACRDNILVSFTEPVCGNADCTEALTISNFVFTPDNGTGMQSISTVTHTAGNNWALLTMNAVSEDGDTASTLRVEEVYTPSGMVKEDSALTTALTKDITAPTLSVKKRKYTTDDILLQFSEPVQDEQCNNSAVSGLTDTDITYADAGADNAQDFAAGEIHSASRDWVYLKLDAVLDATNDAAETIGPTDNKVYDMVGNEWVEAAAAVSTYTDASTTAPTLSSAYSRIGADSTGGNDLIFVQFNEPVFSANTATGNLVAADFLASIGIDSIAHTAGNAFVVLSDDANKTTLGTIDTENNVDTGGADNDIFNAFGNAYADATAAVSITDNTFPTLRGVWVNQFIDHGSTAGLASVNFAVPVGANTAVTNERATTVDDTTGYPSEGSKMYYLTDATGLAAGEGFVSYDTNIALYDTASDLYEFTQVKFDAYYQDDSGAVLMDDDLDLQFVLNDTADFVTPSQFAITTNLPDDGTWTTVTIDLTGTATGTTLAAQTANPEFWGIRVNATTDIATSDDLYIDNIRFSRGASSKANVVTLEYSEAVNLAGDPAEGGSGASATTAGDMTISKTLAGVGAFLNGTLTMPTTTNTVAKSADGAMYTITLANRSGGLITQATPVTLTGLFTPTADVTDIATNAIQTGSTHTPETIIDALDLTTSASVVTDFRPTHITGGQVKLEWTSPSQTSFSHYVIPYASTATVSVATTTLWDEVDAAALSTAGTQEATVTGLTDGTVYYFNIAGVDIKGNATALVTEKSGLPGAAKSSSSGETVAPAVPGNLAATVNDAGKVVLTWTDPTDSDLQNVVIAKSTGTGVDPASVLSTVNAGLKTYTDTNVNIGDVVNYKIKAADKNGNTSAYSSTISITVKLSGTKEAAAAEPINVTLSEQNSSGQSGTATIEEVDGGLKVTLALTGNPTNAQPAHIHSGSCAETGDAKYTLTSVSSGVSETTLDLTLDELKAGYPLAINVHKSSEEAGTYYACGNIEAEETLEEVALAEIIAVETTVPETGIIAEEVTLQDADSGASLTIGAATAATVAAEDGTAVAYTGTIASPKVDAEQTVVAPTGTEAATEVFDVDTGVTTSVTFDTPVTLVLPAKGEVDLAKIYTLYTVDETTGELSQPVECTVKTSGEDKVFECEVTHLTKFVVLASEPEEEEVLAEEEEEEMPFVDVKNHWSKDYVTDLYNQDIVSGKDLTHFKPDDSITRAEFTKVIIGAFGIEVKDAEDISVMPFKDVKASNWYLPYVEAAKEEGLVGGYSDGTFKPDATITRAEAMKILLEAAGVDFEGVKTSTFKDVDQKAWYAKYVNYAAENDVVKGYADGTFGVNKNITRAETAKIVSIMMAE